MSEIESTPREEQTPHAGHARPPVPLLTERRRLARLERTRRQRASHSVQASSSIPRGRAARRGVVSLWVVLIAPAMLLLLCIVADIGKVWLARAELTTALEAASIAAVQQWGDAGGGSTLVPRALGVEYAAGNTVAGAAVAIDANYSAGSLPNENAACSGSLLLFGAASGPLTAITFDADQAPDPGVGLAYAVHAKASATVASLCDDVFGIPLGPYEVTAHATAVFDDADQEPRIVHAEMVSCVP